MVPPTGPHSARIMLVGEAPGEEEVRQATPFVGPSGMLLNEMLHDAEILRSECFITNVARLRPPGNDISAWFAKSKKEVDAGHIPLGNKMVRPPVAEGYELLMKEIELVKPNVIVAFGNVAMWALTGRWGIKSWRGSLLQDTVHSRKCIPTYHPAYILRDYAQRHITTHDLRRAKREAQDSLIHGAEYRFILRPKYDDVWGYLNGILKTLESGPQKLSVDIETRAGHIACLGIATSPTDAICIPFMCVENNEGYWHAEQELQLIRSLRAVLAHPNARVIGQNFIYDSQYIWRHWRFVPSFSRDTMLGHHCCFTSLPKGLDYLSSLYCAHHVYWKDEGKEWNTKIPEDEYWAYNCKDAVITFECDEAIQRSTSALQLGDQGSFQQSMFWPVLQAMVRGVRVDRGRRKSLNTELHAEIVTRNSWLTSVLGHPINIKSPKQMATLLYEDLRQTPIYKRKKSGDMSPRSVTCDDEALKKIAQREPLLRPLVRTVGELRSLGVFLSTFIEAELDKDQRLRCSYNIAGTSTLRLSSSQNAFGSGLNLQNIPEGGAEDKSSADSVELPNVKKIFVPDEGYTFFDGDLDRADLQVVAWECDDDDLKSALRRGLDMHLHSARAVYSLPISDEDMVESSPNYHEVKAKYYAQRQNTRQVVHATNYVGSARTVAANFGLPLREVERFQRIWFELHPGIKEWHKRTESQLRAKRFVTNKFGYRYQIFDRPEHMLPEAIAWIPQSTVACYINRLWMKVYLEQPETQVLLQVHDSLAGQFPSADADRHRQALLDAAASIVVPYDDPLVIPFRIKTSTISWGDCA